MSIDFKALATDGDDFEFLCRDVLESHGAKILSGPAKGPDQKKDMLIEVENRDLLGNTESTIYLVQCKHKAHSGKSVYEADLGANIVSYCRHHGANGYFLITSTTPSNTVSMVLEDIEKNDKLKTLIWDRKKLEHKIETSPDATTILKSYNLSETLDLLFSRVQQIMLGEYHLPFQLIETVEEENRKGLIFAVEGYDENLNPKNERIGYFCVNNPTNEAETTPLLDEFNLVKLTLVSDSYESENITSTNLLYTQLQNFRDEFYQQAILDLLPASEINPTAIRVLQIALQKIPYKPQRVTIEKLREIINYDAHEVGILLIIEAANTAYKLGINELKFDIFNQLKIADNWRFGQVETPALAQHLVQAIAKLDSEERELVDDFFAIFQSTNNLQVKVELIGYFQSLKIQDRDDILGSFFDQYEDLVLPPSHHGIDYRNHQITLFLQGAPLKLSTVKRAYELALTR